MLELWDGDSNKRQICQLFTQICTKQTTSWLMHNWNIFGAWMNHKHTQSYKTHHSPNLKEATTFRLIIFSLISHGGYIQISFCLRTPKILKIGIPGTLEIHNFCVDLQLKWGLKKSCSPHRKLFNNMWHATYTHIF
jgi:hypothetical protein